MYITHKLLNFKYNNSPYDRIITALEELVAKFKHYGAEIYLVGGCVRDALLGRPCHDFDLATNLTPEEMMEMLRKEDLDGSWQIVSPGKNFGTLIFIKSKDVMIDEGEGKTLRPSYIASFEVTTFRAESDYEDHRKPNNIRFSKSLEEDLSRRDLTINSFAYDLFESDLYMLDISYLDDVYNRIIRTVGNPSERFKEDALRMLRVFRFACQLNGKIDPATYEGIKENAKYLSEISTERIRDELNKIILSNAPEKIMLMRDSKLNIEGLKNLLAISDIHQINLLMLLGDHDPAERWAAFFYGLRLYVDPTSELSAINSTYIEYKEKVKSWMIKMKFDSSSIDKVQRILTYCDFAIREDLTKKDIKRILGEHYEDWFMTAACIATLAMEFQNLPGSDRYRWIKDIEKQVSENKEPIALEDLEINGLDLLEIGLYGKQIGEALDNCLDFVLDHPEANTKPILLKYIQQVYN